MTEPSADSPDLLGFAETSADAASSASPEMEGAPRLDGYRVLGVLGQGGMGVVYHAEQVSLDRPVALKAFKVDSASSPDLRAMYLRRFHQEARVLARMGEHENIVQIYDVAKDDRGADYLVMQFVEGMTLFDRLFAVPPLATHESIDVVRRVAKALQHAHDRGIVHRDIKPQNVMLTNDGKVKVMDFGIARADSGVVNTASGAVLGSLQYISPEQVRGEKNIDGRSDIYSLSVTLYYLATGRLPFEDTNPFTLANMHRFHEPPRPRAIRSDIAPELERIILKGMAKRPEERYQTARELERDLAAFLGVPPFLGGPMAIPSTGGMASVARSIFQIGGGRLPAGVTDAGPADVPAETSMLPPGEAARAASTPASKTAAEEWTPVWSESGALFHHLFGWVVPAMLWSGLAAWVYYAPAGYERLVRSSIDAARLATMELPAELFGWLIGAFLWIERTTGLERWGAVGAFAGVLWGLIAASSFAVSFLDRPPHPDEDEVLAARAQGGRLGWLGAPIGWIAALGGVVLTLWMAWLPPLRIDYVGSPPLEESGRLAWLGGHLGMIWTACWMLFRLAAPWDHASRAARSLIPPTLALLSVPLWLDWAGFPALGGWGVAAAAGALHAILLCHLRARLSGFRRSFYWALACAAAIAFKAWASRPSAFAPPEDGDDAALHAAIERDLQEIHRANVVYAVEQNLSIDSLLPDLEQMALTGHLRRLPEPPGVFGEKAEYRQARAWGGASPKSRNHRPGLAERPIVAKPLPPAPTPAPTPTPVPRPSPEAVLQMRPQ